ncbi:GNAT family N-acetyltransferase [Salmonella enterica]|uniref:GNAT family N-acetyltransferase n=1 Tax=Cronobacter sakazakii TaxID=28141 RepID=UPI00124B58AB|nr:GNAT family N-acetyltransferase [Cronobacter sakazakii]EBM7745620.1 GNAT family N-acetyltransferase [Salmonella enterica subsp. enterica serovar Kentucky]EHR9796270.1 GNAT family N-acetyltransferase [Salmonella enterica]ECU5713583.1 GNAT family N-acetyltransferase [Salmonella enterica subsp. enterica serovar Kentucky]EDZ9411636.1 GNAT family N-acetyltransferase [Salmonella enterica subsp. enterica serovar Kentucky]EEC5048850.1 GNAT family N-acetyltransferase [Salmonella enterica subsp. ente
MSEFYSRVASQGDIPFIISECEEGARNGHFHKDILNDQYFEMQIRKLLNASEQGDYSGNYIYILMRTKDDRRVGLIWFCAALDPQGSPRLELRAISIIKELRGKGLGSTLLTDMLESNPHQPLMARCYENSSQMAEMLKRRGFTLYETLPSGTQILLRDPR